MQGNKNVIYRLQLKHNTLKSRTFKVVL